MIANPATQHPYYWAAFVPIGDWTPLAAKGLAQPEYLAKNHRATSAYFRILGAYLS